MSQPKKSANPKLRSSPARAPTKPSTICLRIATKLEWLVAIGRNHKGRYLLLRHGRGHHQDLGSRIKERILRDYFGEVDD
jgi:hypothetical protein